MTMAAQAQSIIRDAEIERGLQELAAPVLSAAGLPASTRIIVVNDGSLNAFVVDPRHIFIHSGLLMRLDDPAQVQAIIAHEAAHIANGHFTRRAANAGNAGTVARLGLLAWVSRPGSPRGMHRPESGWRLGAASSSQRVFFAHTRAEEASADAAAIGYMVSAGVDPPRFSRCSTSFAGRRRCRPAGRTPTC